MPIGNSYPPVLRAPLLARGAVVGVVSPSGPVAGLCPRRTNRGLAAIEAMGFTTRVGAHARYVTGHTAGSEEERAADVNAMIADPEVRVVLSTIGGFNSNQLLASLDFAALARDPKIFIGYSDFTAILLAAYARIGLVGFLGPALLPQFGEFGGLHEFTHSSFRRVLCEPEKPGVIPSSGEMISEFLEWDRDDDRPRSSCRYRRPWSIREGTCEGRVVAGNLGTLLTLTGTPWMPSLEGTLLFLEDDEVETPATMEQMLTQLRDMGVFEQIAGLCLGRFHPRVGLSDPTILSSLVQRNLGSSQFPVAADFDFGHTDPMLTLPIGVRARLTVTDDIEFRILESAIE